MGGLGGSKLGKLACQGAGAAHGKLRMSDSSPLYALTRACSWLYSIGLCPSSATNLRARAVSEGALRWRLESCALLDDALEELAGGAARRTANSETNPGVRHAAWLPGPGLDARFA